jgi:putative ABC transport system ATP-binding protein
MGPSGSGKTTLVSMLGTLLRPSGGKIVLEGIEVTRMKEAELPAVRARKIGFVFQAFNLMEALTVEENVLFPAHLAPCRRLCCAIRACALKRRGKWSPAKMRWRAWMCPIRCPGPTPSAI